MNREQVKQELLKGRTLDELFKFQPGQGCDIYKGEFSLSDEIIYIPDLDLNEIPVHEAVEKEEVDRVVNAMYSGLDFLEQCGGKEELAKELFDYVLEVASGKKVKAEEAGFHDMAIFKQGVTL